MLPLEVITGLGSLAMGWFFKSQAQAQANLMQMHKMGLEKVSSLDNSADKASKRKSSKIHNILATIIISVAFIGLFAVAWASQVPVSVLEEVEPTKLLWGLLEFDRGARVIVANGFTLPPWFAHCVISVVFFHFGTRSARIKI
jgi:hypothetical protein